MHNLFCINVEIHAIFVEGFSSEFYARGRFMKYSMSEGLNYTLLPMKFLIDFADLGFLSESI